MDLTNQNKDRTKKKRSTFIPETIMYGKIPPQAKDMEEAILGAIMIQKDCYDMASAILKPEMFYVEAHSKIFTAMQALANKSQPIDVNMVAEQLRAMEDLEMCGGPYYITKITNTVVSGANIESHCRIVLQKWVQREVIRVSGEMIAAAYEDLQDPFELLDDAVEAYNLVGEASAFGEMTPIDAVLVKAIQHIEDVRNRKVDITGIPSGFKELDRATLGWQNGELIILAARPSVGKTALALNMIRNAAVFFRAICQAEKERKSVAVWSLEMKSIKLILRLLAAESEELLYRIQTGKLDDPQMKNLYARGVQALAGLKVFFDDNAGLTIQKLRSKCRKLKRKNNLGLVVVDYLQLMTPEERSGGTREQEVSRISRGLKNLAQELDIPIIALSQMTREFDKRQKDGGTPHLSDLRESGSLEQDADVVIFLFGPTDGQIAEDASLMDVKYAKVAKQRNGILITQELNFKDEIQLFREIEKVPTLGFGGNWKPVTTGSPDKFIEPGSKFNADEEEKDPF